MQLNEYRVIVFVSSLNWFRLLRYYFLKTLEQDHLSEQCMRADLDLGSGVFLTPRSGTWNKLFPYPGSRILDLWSWISDPGSRIHPKFSESLVIFFWTKIKYFSFSLWTIWLQKKGKTVNFIFSLFFVVGSGMGKSRDLGWEKVGIWDK
jgi:hypothetical protein